MELQAWFQTIAQWRTEEDGGMSNLGIAAKYPADHGIVGGGEPSIPLLLR